MSSNIVPMPPPRPITGVYPPCPPPSFPCGDLERCYDEVKRAQDFLKQMLKDIIACDPSIIGRGTPIVGVTDGTPAQPGMVGEFLQFSNTLPYVVTSTQQSIVFSAGVLPPGDWNVWCWASPSNFITWVNWTLTPQPAGFSGDLWTGIGTGDLEEGVVFISSQVQALTSVPTLLAFTLNYYAITAGNINFVTMARRMR